MKRYSRKMVRSLTTVRVLALTVVLVTVVACFSAPLFPGINAYAQDVPNRFAGIGEDGYLLGSDELGRDVLSRVLLGLRIELIVVISATMIAMALGVVMGLLSGYYQRLGDLLVMRVVDVILSFPPVIIALLATTLYGHSNLTLTLVLGLLFVPNFARVVYGQVLAVASLEYVDASKVFRSGVARRLFLVIGPNTVAPIIVQFTVVIAAAILLESGLSFLGLGVPPPEPSLGAMVASAQRYIGSYPEQLLVPGSILALLILSIGVLGDFLRDVLDPKT